MVAPSAKNQGGWLARLGGARLNTQKAREEPGRKGSGDLRTVLLECTITLIVSLTYQHKRLNEVPIGGNTLRPGKVSSDIGVREVGPILAGEVDYPISELGPLGRGLSRRPEALQHSPLYCPPADTPSRGRGGAG